ncbi:MAG TPA: glycerol kinase GlpK, partial [Thermomicrobiales bacterium]|nr:glycerol kinase GlpK [Thermomicrobiales bacterium]
MTARPPFVLAIDQGTTSSRAIVFDRDANPRGHAQIPVGLQYPQPGWVNQDAAEIWDTTLATAQAVIAETGAAEVAAVGIANQRETTILWDQRTGRPLAPAIVWQSRQSAALVDAIAARGLTETYRQITGLTPDAYFSATKIAWLLAANPALRQRAEAGDVLFGTVDSWLIWNLTGRRRHVTDVTNASRTMLFDIARLEWSDPLLADLGIPRAMLPTVVPTSGFIAETDPALFGRAIPICGAAGDQQAALFGQACFRPGQAKNTYGTGSFLLMNVGEAPPVSPRGLLATPAWQIGDRTTYALEGAIFVTGAAVQWLRDGLGLISEAAAVEPLAASVPDAGGVVFVPALTGLGAPDWDSRARGAIFGITRGTSAAHIARATLDAIAQQTRDVLAAMIADSGFPLTELRVDGGAARDDLLMQMQADALGVPVIRPRIIEATALGAAYLAGLAAGVWRSEAEIAAQWQVDRVFEPAISADERDTRHA